MYMRSLRAFHTHPSTPMRPDPARSKEAKRLPPSLLIIPGLRDSSSFLLLPPPPSSFLLLLPPPSSFLLLLPPPSSSRLPPPCSLLLSQQLLAFPPDSRPAVAHSRRRSPRSLRACAESSVGCPARSDVEMGSRVASFVLFIDMPRGPWSIKRSGSEQTSGSSEDTRRRRKGDGDQVLYTRSRGLIFL